MSYRLFVDAQQAPPDDSWVYARTEADAKDIFHKRGWPCLISLSDISFAKWLLARKPEGEALPEAFRWQVHTDDDHLKERLDQLLKPCSPSTEHRTMQVFHNGNVAVEVEFDPPVRGEEGMEIIMDYAFAKLDEVPDEITHTCRSGRTIRAYFNKTS